MVEFWLTSGRYSAPFDRCRKKKVTLNQSSSTDPARASAPELWICDRARYRGAASIFHRMVMDRLKRVRKLRLRCLKLNCPDAGNYVFDGQNNLA